jgi:hypothetical protein
MSGETRTDNRGDGTREIYERMFGGGAAIAAGGGPALGPEDRRRLIALIWATVDRDRVVAGLGLPAEILPDDPDLGASVVLVRPADGDPIAILEPRTEGRLAATLARHDEGSAGEYVASPIPLDAVGAVAATVGLVAGRPVDGPFGRSVLVTSRPASGHHLVLVERPAGTIAR